MMRGVDAGDIAYLTPEGRARLEIDRMLDIAGWVVQDAARVNLSAARGVAVREFVLKSPHGRVDYLLFVDGQAVGVLEAKNGEQRRIVASVERQLSVIDATRDTVDAVKRRSIPLRRSILERAFSGELVEQDPSDEPASVLLEQICAERAKATPASRRRRVGA